MLQNFFRKFKWFLVYYRRNYILACCCLLLSYVLTLLPPRLIGSLADRIMAQTITISELNYWLVALFFVLIIYYLNTYAWGVLLFKGADVIGKLMHSRVFRKIIRQGQHFFALNPTGSLMGKATNDVDSLTSFVSYGLMALLDATIWPLAIIVLMLSLSWRLTLIAILPFPLLIFWSQKLGSILYARYEAAQEAFDEMNQSVLEGVAGIRVVRAYHLGELEKEAFAHKADLLYKRNVAVISYELLYAPLSKLIPGLAFVLTLAAGVYLIAQNLLSVGSLLSFVLYLGMLTWPMISFGEFINTGQQGVASMDRLDELLNYPEEIVEPTNALVKLEGSSLEFRAYSFAYPPVEADTEACACLQQITFQLEEGQTLGIVGPVGSGKTSLVKQLLRFYAHEPEKIFLAGKALEDYALATLRQEIAYVPQQSFLFSRSVRDNILLGASKADLLSGRAEARLEEVIDLADFRKDIAQLPQGLDSMAGEKGIALSGGQKQRICIARALIRDSEILILDDCLSAVDSLTEERILTALRRERKAKTTLIVSHRLSAVLHADLIIVLDQGRLSARGTHAELLAAGGWYAEQFALQQIAAKKTGELGNEG